MCGRRKWRRLWVGVSYFSTDWIFDKRLGTFFWFFSLYLTIVYNNLPPIKKKRKVNRFIIASRSLISLRASCSHTKWKHYLAMKTKHMSTTIHPEIYERGCSNRTLSPRQRIFFLYSLSVMKIWTNRKNFAVEDYGSSFATDEEWNF